MCNSALWKQGRTGKWLFTGSNVPSPLPMQFPKAFCVTLQREGPGESVVLLASDPACDPWNVAACKLNPLPWRLALLLLGLGGQQARDACRRAMPRCKVHGAARAAGPWFSAYSHFVCCKILALRFPMLVTLCKRAWQWRHVPQRFFF
jgi:hypothetical protein